MWCIYISQCTLKHFLLLQYIFADHPSLIVKLDLQVCCNWFLTSPLDHWQTCCNFWQLEVAHLYFFLSQFSPFSLFWTLFLTQKFLLCWYTENRWSWLKCSRARRPQFQGWRRSDPCLWRSGWDARRPGSGRWWRGRRACSGRGQFPPGEAGSKWPSFVGWYCRRTCKMSFVLKLWMNTFYPSYLKG